MLHSLLLGFEARSRYPLGWGSLSSRGPASSFSYSSLPSSAHARKYPEVDYSYGSGQPSYSSLSAKSRLCHPTSGYGSQNIGVGVLSEPPPLGLWLYGPGSSSDPRARDSGRGSYFEENSIKCV